MYRLRSLKKIEQKLHLAVFPSVRCVVHLPACLSVGWSARPSVGRLVGRSVGPSACTSVGRSVRPPACACSPSACLPACLRVRPSACTAVCPTERLSDRTKRPSVSGCLSGCLSVCPTDTHQPVCENTALTSGRIRPHQHQPTLSSFSHTT